MEQLNHINDLVFSASATNKVLVPIQGSVPLVTFVSEKPIEQMPFAWCGYNSLTGPFWKRRQEYCDAGNYPEDPKNSETSTYVDRYRVGNVGKGKPSKVLRPDSPSPASDSTTGEQCQRCPQTDTTPPVGNLTVDSNGTYPVAWDDLHYKKWKAAALRILQQRTFVVIGGVHIKDLTNQPAKITGLTCCAETQGKYTYTAFVKN